MMEDLMSLMYKRLRIRSPGFSKIDSPGTKISIDNKIMIIISRIMRLIRIFQEILSRTIDLDPRIIDLDQHLAGTYT